MNRAFVIAMAGAWIGLLCYIGWQATDKPPTELERISLMLIFGLWLISSAIENGLKAIADAYRDRARGGR